MTTRRDLLAGAVAAIATPPLPSPIVVNDPLLALEERWQALETDYERVCIAHDRAEFANDPNAEALDVELGACQDRWHEILCEIAETPATTLSGLLVKLRFTQRDVREGKSNYSDEMIASALADLERFAKA